MTSPSSIRAAPSPPTAAFPASTCCGDWPDEAMAALGPDRRTAVVTLTHDPKLDDPALQAALRSPAFYIGALGSRRPMPRASERLAARRLLAGGARAHPRAGRPHHRRPVAGRDRRLHPGPDHRRAPRPPDGMIFAEMAARRGRGRHPRPQRRCRGGAFKKGRRLSAADIAALAAAGQTSVMAVRLEPDDVPRGRGGRAPWPRRVAGDHLTVAAPFTGRCNLMAQRQGVLVVDQRAPRRAQLRRRGDHGRDPAALRPGRAARDGGDGQDHPLRRAARVAGALRSPSPGRPARSSASPLPAAAPVGLIQTRLPGTQGERARQDPSRSTNARLAALGCPPVVERRCAHRDRRAHRRHRGRWRGAEMLLIAGASAITDRRDVIPAAIDAGRRQGRCISACRSIPAICCCWAASASGRCWACPAAPARPSSTASTGCCSG